MSVAYPALVSSETGYYVLRNEEDPIGGLPQLLEAAIAAAQEAGVLLRHEFHSLEGRRGHSQTAAIDSEVETLLKRRLLAALPCGWLGEETGRSGTEARTVWVVDPHDGTGAYLQGRRGSSVSIALVHQARPVLGVVYAFGYPDDDGDLIAWAEGAGPVRRNGREVVGSLVTRDLGHNEIVALSYVASQLPEVNGALVAPSRFIALPSIAYRLALAACSEVVAGVALNPLRSWDFAAGHALLRGAGGLLLDQGGRAVTYDANGDARTIRCFGGAPAAVMQLASRDWCAAMVPDPGERRAAAPQRRHADAGRLRRAQGCLLGQVAGDALGALVEFQGSSRIEKSYPDGLHDLADGGPWSILAGQPTDDSELALTLARCLVRNRDFDPGVTAQAYRNWLRSGPFDIGMTTAAALSGEPAPTSQANGSLMRVSPIGIFAAGNPEKAARFAADDSKLTHPHPVCIAACAGFAAAIAVGVDGGDRQAMFDAALEYGGELSPRLRETLSASQIGLPADYETQMGWVLIALQNAFFYLKAGTSVADAVVATVSRGGDTDTNAAIVGALLGAVGGRAEIPDQWRLMVLSCRASTALGALQPRPQEYWADDLMELAEGLLDAGGTR
jgi:ADP-ribosylglycohydrolase/fructose-1,6-bisphosphatase/inositol monophosphatase family enzyme